MNMQISKFTTGCSRLALIVALFATFLTPTVAIVGTVQAADSLPPCKLGEDPSGGKCSLNACDPNAAAGAANACACDPALQSCKGSPGCVGADCGLIAKYFNPFMKFLTGVVGIVVTISIIVGGIQYTTSADDPQKVAAAKGRIINAVLGLLAYIFLWAFLQWLVPGGVFNG